MSDKKSLKTLKKQVKKQEKAFNKALQQALKKRLKASDNKQLSIQDLSNKAINELASNLVEQLIVASPQQENKVSQLKIKPSGMSFALTPHKSSPCKGCPARQGGLCACAIKSAKKKKTG